MKIKKPKDFWSGVMFVAFGLFFMVSGMHYKAGTAASMGAGYFPRLLSGALILTGTILSLGSLWTGPAGEAPGRFNWRTMVLIIGPVFLFGRLLQPLGLVLSLFVLIGGVSYASHEFKWKDTLLNALVLTLLCVGIFVWSLKLHFRLWPFS